jgi:hypothetical protein
MSAVEMCEKLRVSTVFNERGNSLTSLRIIAEVLELPPNICIKPFASIKENKIQHKSLTTWCRQFQLIIHSMIKQLSS